MNKKNLVIGAVALIVVIFGTATFFFRKNQSAEVQSQSHLLLRDGAAELGDANAAVTVVEFFDPECESCRRFHPMTKMMLEEFKGKVRLVLRYAPFHANSKFAIQILEAAKKQNLYWETLEVLYHYQPQWGDHHNPQPQFIWSYLPQVAGLDVEKVRSDMNDPAINEIITKDLEEGQKLGVQRTPQFFVNGEPLTNFGYEPLRQLILRHIR